MTEFSIIVPVFNCAVLLSDCINSVLNQSIPDFELLLVDDGSTDGSGSLCDQFAQEDPRIRVFHKANGGAASARNVGLDNAAGNHLLFIDGDDTIEEDMLEQLLRLQGENKTQMSVFGMAFDYYSVVGTIEKTEHLSVGHCGRVQTSSLLANYSKYYLDNALSSACNKVFSGELIRKHSLRFYKDMTLYEDLEFVLRYLRYCEQIMFSDQVLYHYRIFIRSPYHHKRVTDMSQLQTNLDRLIGTALTLDSPEAAQRSADLCAQLFDQHLMMAGYSRTELSHAVEQIRNCTALTALSQVGIEPSADSSPSWPLLCSGQTDPLYRLLRRRHWIRQIKQIVKPLLRRIGLYR